MLFCHFQWFLSLDINFGLLTANQKKSSKILKNKLKSQKIIRNQELPLRMLTMIEKPANQEKSLEIRALLLILLMDLVYDLVISIDL